MSASINMMISLLQSLTVTVLVCALCLTYPQLTRGEDDTSSLVVEHTFDTGFDAVFTRRGTIDLQSVNSGRGGGGEGEYINEFLLTDHQKDKLKELAASNGIYRVRIGQRTSEDKPCTYVYSFIKACVIYESRLSHTLRVNVDQSGSLIAAALISSTPYCQGLTPTHGQLDDFETIVEVQRNVDGPAPDSLAYIQKLEHEKKKATLEGQQGESKSFFAKYWMYIVPVVVMVMFMSNADSSGGGGGAPARG